MSAGRGVRHARAGSGTIQRNGDDLVNSSAKQLTAHRSRHFISPYKTRLQDQEGSLMGTLERNGVVYLRPQRANINLPSGPWEFGNFCSAPIGEKRDRKTSFPQEVDNSRWKLKRPRLFPDLEAEDGKALLRGALVDRFINSKSVENDLEAQFKRAIRLYRYMSLPDTHGGIPRPVYRPFLKRNLLYMRVAKNGKNLEVDGKPTLGWTVNSSKAKHDYRGNVRKRKEMEHRVKREHMDRLVAGIRERKKPKEEVLSSSEVDSSFPMVHHLSPRACTLANGIAGDNSKQVCPSPVTSMITFIDVRNKDLPGSRHAMIIVYMATEIDGVFGEIKRLPSATVTMQVNDRSKVNVIDFPQSVGSLKRKGGRESTEVHSRNDYVIIRVTFSGEEDAKISGGRTLRCVPSRQAEKAEVKVTRRSSGTTRRKSFPEETLTMLGARCISSSTSDSPGGIICGYGAINLVPESMLPPNSFPHDRSVTKKIVELGKKMHMGPFVRMCIAQESSGETSSSDDETSRCSSRSTFENSDDDASSEHSEIECALNEPSASTASDGLTELLQARSKHELSLSFPSQICYRFITRENKEPNTSFPESHFSSTPDDPPYVASFASVSSSSESAACARSCKYENGSSSPLKEVSRLLNGHVRSKLQALLPKVVSPPKCSPGSPQKLRFDAPRRDSPLSETIDLFANRFDSCSKLAPPRRIANDDKITVPELHYTNYPEPDGNGVVTRFLSPANKCFFCQGTFPDMFALLLHLRTSYPRLDVVYRGDMRDTSVDNSSAPVYVDVFIREHFDGSFEGPVARQYLNSRNRLAPQRCTLNDRLTYLVHRSMARAVRGMRKDMSVFFTKSDREKRAVVERNAAYFGFRSRHPHAATRASQISPKQIDQEWLREFIIRQIEDFLDLSRMEKDFMAMWNIFLLNINHKPLGRCHVYRTCRLFIQKHREELLEKEMRSAWLLHLTALHEKEALSTDEVYDLIMRLQGNYDPEQDVCHVVHATRLRLEAAANSSVKRDPPAWQREPAVGPKMCVLRSASMVHLPSAESNLDSEDVLKKFMIDVVPDGRRSSTGSMEEPTKHSAGRRHRETDCSKYLVSPRATQPPRWLSFAE